MIAPSGGSIGERRGRRRATLADRCGMVSAMGSILLLPRPSRPDRVSNGLRSSISEALGDDVVRDESDR